jgi:hypothetical protein
MTVGQVCRRRAPGRRRRSGREGSRSGVHREAGSGRMSCARPTQCRSRWGGRIRETVGFAFGLHSSQRNGGFGIRGFRSGGGSDCSLASYVKYVSDAYGCTVWLQLRPNTDVLQPDSMKLIGTRWNTGPKRDPPGVRAPLDSPRSRDEPIPIPISADWPDGASGSLRIKDSSCRLGPAHLESSIRSDQRGKRLGAD